MFHSREVGRTPQRSSIVIADALRTPDHQQQREALL
jgi:hypothetical protein